MSHKNITIAYSNYEKKDWKKATRKFFVIGS